MGLASVVVGQVFSDLSSQAGTFNISTFRSQLNSLGGVMRTNMFQVQIAIPPYLMVDGLTSQTLTFFCYATNLPGLNLVTKAIQRYGYGPLEKMPIGFEHDDVSFNFIGDADGVILNFFNDWIRSQVECSSDGQPNSPVQSRPNSFGPMNPYMVNYKSNYEADVSINVFDSTGNNLAYNVNLQHACPTSVGDIYLNWNPNDEFMIIPVKFSFLDTSYISQISPNFSSLLSQGLAYTENYAAGALASTIIQPVINTATNLITSLF